MNGDLRKGIRGGTFLGDTLFECSIETFFFKPNTWKPFPGDGTPGALKA